jgi:hypothetical protein
MRIVRRQITIIYRTKQIGYVGQFYQLIRRFVLILIATFTQSPETVGASSKSD